MPDDKKYYWLKLKRDFFKRHDIQIVEDMPNGKEYVLFYLKLLVESIDHEGSLRFNDLIPYNDQMLATITNTNIDIVRSAIKILQQLNLLEVLDDQTIFIKDTVKMLGEGASTERVQRFRERKSQLQITDETARNVTETLHETEIEIEKEIEIDKELEIDSKRKRFSPPTINDVAKYCRERNKGVNPEKWINHYTANGWKVGKNKMVDWKSAVRTWEPDDTQKQSEAERILNL